MFWVLKKKLNEVGASSVELLVLMAFGLVVSLPAFWLLFNKYVNDDLADRVMRGYAALQNPDLYYVGLDVTGIHAPREECLDIKLQEISDGMYLSTGISGYCTILFEKVTGFPVDPNGYLGNGFDELGGACGPAPASLVTKFESQVPLNLPDGKMYGAGIFLISKPELNTTIKGQNGSGYTIRGGSGLTAGSCAG